MSSSIEKTSGLLAQSLHDSCLGDQNGVESQAKLCGNLRGRAVLASRGDKAHWVAGRNSGLLPIEPVAGAGERMVTLAGAGSVLGSVD